VTLFLAKGPALKNSFIPLLLLIVLTAAGPGFAGTAEQNTSIRFIKTGAGHLQSANHQAARDAFLEALRYNDADPAAHLGLGIAYFHLRDDGYAERELSRALLLDPGLADGHVWMGELFYRKDDLAGAVAHWEKAVQLNPSAEHLRARLERIRKEYGAEKDFNHDVTGHFLIKYEGREKIEAGRIILRILEEAYGEIGRALSFYPDQEIQVILYSARQFQEVTNAPGWSGGVYDGKIRIPIGGIDKETSGLRRLLFHEYAHAVVRALAPRCPTWLNEGLAQYFEGRRIETSEREALRQMASSGKIPSLAALNGSFTGLSGKQAFVAYLISLSSVGYMIDAFGMYRIKAVLEELGTGAAVEKAVDSGMALSYDELEREWRQSLL
jgi:tetratricopeptide (TPR) repeat protein